LAQGWVKSEMKNETKNTTEAQLLDLLKKVLPKATHDAQLAGKIYQAIELELKAKARDSAFEKFCAKVELRDLESKSLEEVKTQLAASFGQGDVTLKPNRKEKSVAVEVSLTDGTQFSGEIKVNPNAGAEASEEQEITLKFVPFPVCLPGDKELVWLLGKRENMSPEEGGMALTKAEQEFWASKTGQKLLRDRVERSFPEFIARVPAGMLNELGLKRHYKTPEPIKPLRALKKT
jgi:Na+-translocating ferredoxin:NAD+ oxidoreductase RnfG subunit